MHPQCLFLVKIYKRSFFVPMKISIFAFEKNLYILPGRVSVMYYIRCH